MRTPIEEALLYEVREVRAQMDAVTALLTPESSDEDLMADLARTLKDLARLIGEQSAELRELRAHIADLSAVLQDSD